MTTPVASPDPLAAALNELVSLGVRMARVVTAVAEIEQRTAAAAATALPAEGETPVSYEHAGQIGRGIDIADEALAKATPRVATLALSLDRIKRAVRRTVALARRLEHGWPRQTRSGAASDNRRAMMLRQAARGVGDRIRARTGSDAEAAERLFDDLAECLDDPACEEDLLMRPVEEMVRILCRKIGLDPDPEPVPTAAPPARRHDPG